MTNKEMLAIGKTISNLMRYGTDEPEPEQEKEELTGRAKACSDWTEIFAEIARQKKPISEQELYAKILTQKILRGEPLTDEFLSHRPKPKR